MKTDTPPEVDTDMDTDTPPERPAAPDDAAAPPARPPEAPGRPPRSIRTAGGAPSVPAFAAAALGGAGLLGLLMTAGGLDVTRLYAEAPCPALRVALHNALAAFLLAFPPFAVALRVGLLRRVARPGCRTESGEPEGWGAPGRGIP